MAALTQKLAYKGVQKAAERGPRHQGELHAEMVKAALADLQLYPTTLSIWANLWGNDMSKRAGSFFWKAMHGAYKLGSYWANIPGYAERAACKHCDSLETMGHILTECSAPGQETLWTLARALLEKKKIDLPRISLGLAMGAPSIAQPPPDSADGEKGKHRLCMITLTETVHLIWKIRCERVIAWAEEPGKVHTEKEIRAKWMHAMNSRLQLDIARTGNKWKRRKLSRAKVLATWTGTLEDESALPEDWINEKGVLVGKLGNPQIQEQRRSPTSRSPTLPDPGRA